LVCRFGCGPLVDNFRDFLECLDCVVGRYRLRLHAEVAYTTFVQHIVGCYSVSVDDRRLEEVLSHIRSSDVDRAWYLLEGRTVPDVVIETPEAIVVIEGKRTEAGPTTMTSWLEGRHQMWRHRDAAWEQRGMKRVYGFFIVGRDDLEILSLWEDASKNTITPAVLESSLPHRTVDERADLSQCFLRVTTWKLVCQRFTIDFGKLPNTTSDLEHA
jgi:hypothetical protein